MLDWQDPSTWAVLVVDDEPDNLEVVADTLAFFGVSVKTAEDGIEGLAVLQEFNANLILLDLSMPKMNGWETRMRIKADAKTALIPIVALTAHAMPGDPERALAAGFDGYVIKPINVVTLVGDIRSAVINQPSKASLVAPGQPTENGATEPNQPPTSNQEHDDIQSAAVSQPGVESPVAPGQPAASGATEPDQPSTSDKKPVSKETLTS